jgi:hypothetical protein
MSKLVGASFIALGTGGIALALLKDTKYDPLVKLRITKPKIVSKVQQDFRCEVLFLKIVSNYFQTFEIQKQINEITIQPEGIIYSGGNQLNEVSKKRVAELQAQKDKAQKLYESAIKEYNESICGQEMDAMDCANGGSCLKKTQFASDCIKNGIAYFEEYNFWSKVEPDLKNLTDEEFRKKYWIGSLQKDAKSYHKTQLPIKLKSIAELKKAYDTCDVANVDCLSLKEDIATLSDTYNRYKANPDSNRVGSPTMADMLSTKAKLDIKQDLFNKTSCSSKQLVRTGVSYKDVRDCVKLDESIKFLKDEILRYEKKKLELGDKWLPWVEKRLQSFKDEVKNKEEDFVSKGCKARLESEKLKDNAIILTDMSSQQENNILKKNVTEQYAYIGIGALVLVTGLYMVLKK